MADAGPARDTPGFQQRSEPPAKFSRPWLAFGHEPASEQAHAARSRDAAPAGPSPARSSAPSRKHGAVVAIVVVVAARVGGGIGGRRRGSRVRIVVRPRLAEVGGHRREHVRLRGRRQSAGVDPGREEPRAGDGEGHVAVGPQGDDRDRGPALLRAQRASISRASLVPRWPTSRPARSSRAARRSRSSSSATSTSRVSRPCSAR